MTTKRLMRAKMKVQSVAPFPSPSTGVDATSETITLNAVAAGRYPEDGSDENNTFAKFTPQATISITIANPELLGKIKQGDEYYVDFTQAPQA